MPKRYIVRIRRILDEVHVVRAVSKADARQHVIDAVEEGEGERIIVREVVEDA